MIKGNITPPMFKIKNAKIVYRHVYAVALAYFLKIKKAAGIDYYNGNKADKFLNGNGFSEFKEMLYNPTIELRTILEKSFGNEVDDEKNIPDLCWADDLVGQDGILSLRVDEYKETLSQFEEMIRQKCLLQDFDACNKLQKRMNTYKNVDFIEFFVRGNILPKYGFPVDVVELHRNKEQEYDSNNELSLQRDLHMAIAEYAPGADVIANDQLYTSRYIKRQQKIKEAGTMFYESYVAKCKRCETWNYDETRFDETKECSGCGVSGLIWEDSISPRDGFISEKEIKAVPMTRPDRQYKSDDSYIGDGRTLEVQEVNCGGGKITLVSSENDKIMTVSNDWFYVCKLCGFSVNMNEVPKFIPAARTKKTGLITRVSFKNSAMQGVRSITLDPEASHVDSWGRLCKSNNLFKVRLNHTFATDVVQIAFDKPFINNDQAFSVMYGLLNAMATTMDIERLDISGCIGSTKSSYKIMLFDVNAGGAGNVSRLIQNHGEMLKKIIQVAYNNLDKCPGNCDSSCYSCLRSYYNQKLHDRLNRKSGAEFLSQYC